MKKIDLAHICCHKLVNKMELLMSLQKFTMKRTGSAFLFIKNNAKISLISNNSL